MTTLRVRLALPAALAAAFAATAARADVKLPAIFGPHMVLQRDAEDKVWGTADPGEEVTVKIADQTKTAKAGDDGAWSVKLDPLPAGGPHTMTVSGKNAITYDDVLVGEVWLCSGQSNMQWGVGGERDADLAIATAKYPNIRLITVPNVGTQEPQSTFRGEWQPCSPQTVPGFSAVGYEFGRTLHQYLDVPVGLINDSWGGSAAESWVRRDILEKDETYKDLIASWEEREKQYEGAEEGSQERRGLENQMRGNFRPGNIYNGVLKPTIGYGIRGVIWYQGESNAGRAYQYRDLFPLMIQSWRDEWGIGDFPFYWVQLADFQAEKAEPAESAWAELREAQTMTLDKLPRTGQAVIIDLGEGRDIHPRNKLDVAKRLARLALAEVYGEDIVHQSPRYKGMEVKDGKAIVTFDHVGPGGLYAFDKEELDGFTVAGEDKVFHNAKAKIVAEDKVEVWSDDVKEPVAVRYAWADNPVVNLYNRAGLPATPFRTDDWPGVTANNTR
jgi:sialate O-acetylesterase